MALSQKVSGINASREREIPSRIRNQQSECNNCIGIFKYLGNYGKLETNLGSHKSSAVILVAIG